MQIYDLSYETRQKLTMKQIMFNVSSFHHWVHVNLENILDRINVYLFCKLSFIPEATILNPVILLLNNVGYL